MYVLKSVKLSKLLKIELPGLKSALDDIIIMVLLVWSLTLKFRLSLNPALSETVLYELETWKVTLFNWLPTYQV